MNGFLFDENLPLNLTIKPSLPIYHVSVLGQSPTDTQIWEYAKENDLVIVTKDADFSERLMLESSPAKVIHLRFGNLRKKDFHQFLEMVWSDIENLIVDHQLINVFTDRIEAVK